MSDGEFWEAVYNQQDPDAVADRYWPDDDTPIGSLDRTECPVCHAYGACGYDAEGRALIHSLNDEEDDL